MKKLRMFLSMALFAMVGNAMADELTVADFSIAAGETKNISMVLNNPTNSFIAFEFWMRLPDGVRIAEENNKLAASLNSSRSDGHDLVVSESSDGVYHFLCYSYPIQVLRGNSGELISLKVTCADDAAEGNVSGTVYDLIFSDPDKHQVDLADVTFGITITPYGTGGYVLDETSSDEVVAGTYERIVLKRTFAEGWNTVCLPFAVDAIEEAFGTGAKAYAFDDFADDELVSVPTTLLEPCTPYVIYVPAAITDDIILTNVSIDKEDIEAGSVCINKNGDYYFRGTFAPVAPGMWEKEDSSDDIYGVTPDGKILKAGAEASIKGFRGYFDLPEGTAVKAFNFADDATGISDLNVDLNPDEAIYNLAGQRISKKHKGVNITKGKKILK